MIDPTGQGKQEAGKLLVAMRKESEGRPPDFHIMSDGVHRGIRFVMREATNHQFLFETLMQFGIPRERLIKGVTEYDPQKPNEGNLAFVVIRDITADELGRMVEIGLFDEKAREALAKRLGGVPSRG